MNSLAKCLFSTCGSAKDSQRQKDGKLAPRYTIMRCNVGVGDVGHVRKQGMTPRREQWPHKRVYPGIWCLRRFCSKQSPKRLRIQPLLFIYCHLGISEDRRSVAKSCNCERSGVIFLAVHPNSACSVALDEEVSEDVEEVPPFRGQNIGQNGKARALGTRYGHRL